MSTKVEIMNFLAIQLKKIFGWNISLTLNFISLLLIIQMSVNFDENGEKNPPGFKLNING